MESSGVTVPPFTIFMTLVQELNVYDTHFVKANIALPTRSW